MESGLFMKPMTGHKQLFWASSLVLLAAVISVWVVKSSAEVLHYRCDGELTVGHAREPLSVCVSYTRYAWWKKRLFKRDGVMRVDMPNRGSREFEVQSGDGNTLLYQWDPLNRKYVVAGLFNAPDIGISCEGGRGFFNGKAVLVK